MCGIIGIIKFNGEFVRREELEKLNGALLHRGPDDEGYYIDGSVGLAMRRLSIIDPAGGNQPMTSPDGNLTIVFNGEIYNYKSIRSDLSSLGHHFTTHSDTEVVLGAYRQWGELALDRFNGMWGLAIYDRARREVFLSRDRLGKKQIYYAKKNGYMVFGSEMKIPMLFDPENRRLRISALPEYLTYSYIGGPQTALEGVYLLPEASWCRIRLNGEMQEKKYWEMKTALHRVAPYSSEEDAAEAAYALLVDAVKQRLVADVPISVMLSSGLDSSSCAFILARELNVTLKTFSLGFADRDFDESQDAAALARRLDLPHERWVMKGKDFLREFPRFMTHSDSLQANTAQIVYYFVSRMINNDGFKVSLNGSGGDELFAGYQTYQADRIFRYYRHLPAAAKRLAAWTAKLLPPTLGRVSFEYAFKKFTECPYRSPLEAHGYWRTIFSEEALNDTLSPAATASRLSFTRIYDDAFRDIGNATGSINDFLYADMNAWLIPMLPWTDNMSMAQSVEIRMPFLDYRLVEFALGQPAKFLFNGWRTKRMMKLFLKKRLPAEVLRRRKRGTHLPVSRWLNRELAELRQHWLSREQLNREGLFNMEAVDRLVEEHRTGVADHTFKLWNLIVFSAWKAHHGVSL